MGFSMMSDTNFEQARHNMVEQQIRTWTVLDMTVLNTIHAAPRQDYVPEQYRKLAYMDIAIPLDHDQEMMHPKIEAHLLQALQIKPEDKILEIGTGSGYLTSLLATLGAHVDSVDIFPDFQNSALKKLHDHGVHNVTMLEGDASNGWGNKDQYDVIAITGSLPEIPPQYLSSLSIGGRLFAIEGEGKAMEAISVIRSHGDRWTKKSLFEYEVPVLINASRPKEFEF